MSESREELATRKLQSLPPGLGFCFDTGLEPEEVWLPEGPCRLSHFPCIAVAPCSPAALVVALFLCQAGDLAAHEPRGS